MDAVPLEPKTTEVPYFTTEPRKQTEWEPAYTPVGTSPQPGGYSWALGHTLKPRALTPHSCLLWNAHGGGWGWGGSLVRVGLELTI